MAKSNSSKGGGKDKKSSKSGIVAGGSSTTKAAAAPTGVNASKKHAATAITQGQQGTDTTADGKNVDLPASQYLYSWVVYGLCVYLTFVILYNAYKVRMHAIKEYGPVIHEFDPYFNYRATEVRFVITSSVVHQQMFWSSCVRSFPSVVQLLGSYSVVSR
mmetsp:Transcript_42041/g.101065  ORF Transcript_42041/g.101065 Transcript_42041/m.101065 type:complete len:160 (-) Transcript_42041:2986-3465(-)